MKKTVTLGGALVLVCTNASAVPVVPEPSDGGNVTNANGLLWPTTPPQPVMGYLGGPVLAPTVTVVPVFWGPNVDPATVSKIGDFYAALMHGTMVHALNEFSLPPAQFSTPTFGGPGTVTTPVTIAPRNTQTTLTNDDIGTELGKQLNARNLPYSADALYMVHLPPGITVRYSNGSGGYATSCVDFCGYHTYTIQDLGFLCADCNSQTHVPYAVLPDQSGGCAPVSNPGGGRARGCGDLSPLDDLTTVASHEILEAMTDTENNADPPPAPKHLAWAGVFDEIGDPCAFAAMGNGAFQEVADVQDHYWTAQKFFSNVEYARLRGVPANGCAPYPTSACCTPGAPGAAATCSWVQRGESCPVGATDTVVRFDLPDGLGTPDITFEPFFDGSRYYTSPFCLWIDGATQPSWCLGVASIATDDRITVTLGAGDSPTGQIVNCRSGSCNPGGPEPARLAFTTDTGGNRVYAYPTENAIATVPAIPRGGLVLVSGAMLGLGLVAKRRRAT
jgi:hypothetical protein